MPLEFGIGEMAGQRHALVVISSGPASVEMTQGDEHGLVLRRHLAALAAGLLVVAAVATACTCDHPATGDRDADARPADVAAKTRAVSAAARARASWYAARRDLYDGIPTIVRFAPADKRLAQRIWRYLDSVDRTFNDYRSDSEVSRINARRRPARLSVSVEMAAALRRALRAYRLTGGVFDITVRPLRRLWKRAAARGRVPSKGAIARASAAVGSDKLVLAGRALTTRARGMSLDFGGLIKGVAVDEVVRMLRAAKARAFLVQLGGQTAAFGHSPRGRPHIIGIEDPRQPQRQWTQIQDSGGGLCGATSSNAHRAIRVGAKSYYHILDPRTGRPVRSSLLFSSVVFRGTGRCWLADALSTACAAMTSARALRLVERLGGEALIVTTRAGRLVEHKTKGWNDLLYRGASGK